jgi:hypothetical protein
MKLIIAGSRTILTPWFAIEGLVQSTGIKRSDITEIVSGTAKGIDQSGEVLADSIWHKPLKKFPADWDKHGKAAGPIRNKEMAEYADALLLIWDGESRGSANMKETMLKLNKPVYEVILRKHNV